jgi:hypothetical protein
VTNGAKDEQAQRKLDFQLDRELEDTFPASDALKITRRTPKVRRTPSKAGGGIGRTGMADCQSVISGAIGAN